MANRTTDPEPPRAGFKHFKCRYCNEFVYPLRTKTKNTPLEVPMFKYNNMEFWPGEQEQAIIQHKLSHEDSIPFWNHQNKLHKQHTVIPKLIDEKWITNRGLMYAAINHVPLKEHEFTFVKYFSMFTSRFTTALLFTTRMIKWAEFWDAQNVPEVIEYDDGIEKTKRELGKELSTLATEYVVQYRDLMLKLLESNQTMLMDQYSDQERVDLLQNAFLVPAFISRVVNGKTLPCSN
jgi:hypothetical protein